MPTTLPNNSAIQTGGRFDADIALSLRIPSRSRYLDLLETELPMIWLILLAVLAAGFLGGAIGGQIAESNYPPKNCREEINRFFFKNSDCDTVFATRLGNITFGGLSALLFWGLYGPLTAHPVIGTAGQSGSVFLSLGDLMGSILVGTGGPTFLLAEARRRCTKRKAEKGRKNL
jgi:hypothetical protein